ncbi:putative quercetin-3-sulfate 4'-sulfotransferase [Helianthus anomalus]
MEDIFETLPQHSCSLLKCELTCYKYTNFCTFQKWFEGDLILAQQSFKPELTDVLLCGCPGSSTAWLKALAFAIVTRQKFDKTTSPLLPTSLHDCVPFIERNSSLSLVATHLPYASLPRSVIGSNCKIVYIYRNIKDVMISHYHFMRESLKLPLEAVPFEEFCKGVLFNGPYWDHIMGYWKASLERPGEIMFLKYEDLIRDPTNNAKRLAEFVGYPFSAEEAKAGVVDNIIKMCSGKLCNLEVNISGKCRPEEPCGIKKRPFHLWTIGRTTSRL